MKYWEEQGKIKIAAPAKINLFLEILGKRPDGYHEIETVMQEVSLCDYIYMENRGRDIEFTCSNPKLPVGADNLVLKAVRLFQEESRVFRGVKIYLEKRIPVGAGLGGGSSDAVATLFGLNKVWQVGYDEKKLMSLAGKLGSDTPFFVSGDTAICRGRGEVVTPYPLNVKYNYIIIYPRFEVSTATVYKNFKIVLTKNLKDVNFLLQSLSSGSPDKLGACLHNRLEEVVFRLYPDIERIKKTLAKYDFCGILLSGSGSALYGLCKGERDSKEIEQQIKMLDIGDVFVVTNDFNDNAK
ncbi:MAG: 4-(cytidine 5'-diphospho)-2-C-methyl-D-erythritol kinase [Candidatus Brocadia sp. AMX2]|uniref:4-diphosphocytidyl-2-C-methyl-D-erythritol kinase n=1 Tax=Candidatus Brocadia sinica JPN1 TaxID=1197129 RepID=A0ABQ0JUI6_9BACT|nr:MULTISPECIES: 4-(cytidine 5'-diphospho)-2-C-methyl-D-erythritol kinase [Brocadia]MBC6932946.1 4-(cytidine 5'-diphospho)-2-C-methyl-D-erythritol kinase [Candidatus Brocadia sp.]MBL1169252.1 4-(cytidine 5'-diphospho)-2-C-methyl-D-erythritol kinase [Candidatus Brocadia sp. AMX1]MCK6467407.1 4-(cytidine 5'-diphospho)-2-C-methyl-D-erythritol kinase [Candidatus Brocadia sinica]NOG41751.1 4-(cytidine 5'-diphospho)-2-C-methyl-D-erythritol kinase [Planctomycetota bacterium]KAA0241892.1 MAG: 4-(cytid